MILAAAHLSAATIQQLAVEIGYSETAFVAGPIEPGTTPIPIRYFAPGGEIDFCGHTTIATAVGIGESVGHGQCTLATAAGPVTITARGEGGRTIGTLVSSPVAAHPIPRHRQVKPRRLNTLGHSGYGCYWAPANKVIKLWGASSPNMTP